MKNKDTYWALVAGGTGGHIIPALVFGAWLQKNHGILPIKYFTGNRKLERVIFEFHGEEPCFLPLSGSPAGIRGLSAFFRFFGMWYVTLRLALSFLRTPPKALFLFGGYLSVPFIVVAKILRIPTVIHEQNALAGKATRLASHLGIPVCTGWRECCYIKKEKFIFSGIPVRKLQHLHVLDAWNKLVPGSALPLGKVVLVLGGSLGSKLLVELALDLSYNTKYAMFHFLILSEEDLSSEEKKRKNVTFLKPQWDMSPLYSLAFVAIARGGGSTLAELLAYNIPGLVIPFSKSADKHQEKNAQAFKDFGGGSFWNEEQSLEILEERFDETLAIARRKNKFRTENRIFSCSHNGDAVSQKIFEVMTATYTKGDAPSER
jgi:UDP-N-acetylglucosamine--N-acetylmuramyl-(pentapeptide) pyrophosphoryl-undecaprenol N-acetylglucosamine transferase